MLDNRKILVLAPHTDDGELGCGGSISRWLEENCEVHYIAFSAAEESVPEGYPKNQLREEVKKAMAIIGVPDDNLKVYNYAVRKLNFVRQEILDMLIQLRNDIQPDLVVIPCSQDVHQDHQTIHNEAVRAFRHISIIGYELIWNNLSFHTDLFVELTEEQLQAKISALEAYETQRHRPYMRADFIRSLAIVRGVQINKQYAESFEVIRWII